MDLSSPMDSSSFDETSGVLEDSRESIAKLRLHASSDEPRIFGLSSSGRMVELDRGFEEGYCVFVSVYKIVGRSGQQTKDRDIDLASAIYGLDQIKYSNEVCQQPNQPPIQ